MSLACPVSNSTSVEINKKADNEIQKTMTAANATPTPLVEKKIPFDKEISLDESVRKPEFNFADRRTLKNYLKWGDVCSFDNEDLAEGDKGRIRSVPVAKDQFVIEVFCNQSGAYNFDYLLYFYDERSSPFTAKLLSFEYFDTDQGKVVRHFTSNPVGAGFDEEKKEIVLTTKYAGAGQCGWEGRYRIDNGAAVIKDLRAQWNCQHGIDYPKWEKQSPEALRKKAAETVYDQF